jgi:hypothetical protein
MARVVCVISGAMTGVREDAPRLVDTSHPLGRAGVGMEVRVIALSQFAVGLAHLPVIRVARHPEDLVGIGPELRHRSLQWVVFVTPAVPVGSSG